jgi:hypothetical protein
LTLRRERLRGIKLGRVAQPVRTSVGKGKQKPWQRRIDDLEAALELALDDRLKMSRELARYQAKFGVEDRVRGTT